MQFRDAIDAQKSLQVKKVCKEFKTFIHQCCVGKSKEGKTSSKKSRKEQKLKKDKVCDSLLLVDVNERINNDCSWFTILHLNISS